MENVHLKVVNVRFHETKLIHLLFERLVNLNYYNSVFGIHIVVNTYVICKIIYGPVDTKSKVFGRFGTTYIVDLHVCHLLRLNIFHAT